MNYPIPRIGPAKGPRAETTIKANKFHNVSSAAEPELSVDCGRTADSKQTHAEPELSVDCGRTADSKQTHRDKRKRKVPELPGPIICGTAIDSKQIQAYVIKHTSSWVARKEVLNRNKNLLQLRVMVAALKAETNTRVVTSNPDPRSTAQLQSCISMLTVECSVMKWELRFLTHIYNARRGKSADIAAAARSMARLHDKRIDALETVTEADLSQDTDLVAVVAADHEGKSSTFFNGGGVKAIADRYMFRQKWEKDVLALCQAQRFT